MKTKFYLISIFVFFTACIHRQTIYQKTAIEDLVANGIIVDISFNERQLIKRFGKPIKIEKNEIDNPYYDEFKDESICYYYPGLVVIYYNHKHPKSGWKKISCIEISGDNYKLPYGIKIGMQISEVTSMFGQTPYKHEVEDMICFVYEGNESNHAQIVFAFKDNALAKVIWSNWP